MNRRGVLAGLAAGIGSSFLTGRGSPAVAQAGSGNRMSKWAYSTEGFDRIVHRVDGIETVTYAIGEGEPLVYFHGGGTFHGFEWVRALANEFRVFCPYHPNFGESGDAPFDQMEDEEIRTVMKRIKTLQASPQTLAAHLREESVVLEKKVSERKKTAAALIADLD